MLQRADVVGDYQIESVLGRGGMGVVYRARHAGLDREVALKVLADELSAQPEFVARLRREGRLQASLDHPHLLTVYEAGDSEQGAYLAMQLVPGTTLAQLLEQRVVDAARALSLLRQIADALDAVHAAGLVHRDVKPHNVLVGEAEDAYLSDFGLTRPGGVHDTLGSSGPLGTVAYLAPEVIDGGEATPASDRYAFAAMVFECLAGGPPFPRQTQAAVLHAHLTEPPPRISRRRRALPEGLDDVLAKGLAKDPQARPATARALVESVAKALAGADLEAPPHAAAALDATTLEPGRPARAAGPRRRDRRPLEWLAAALAGAAVALGLAALLHHGHATATATAAGVPKPLPGLKVLGSDLRRPGRTLDCRGHAPRPASPSCTVAQSALPGRTLVIQQDGVIRRWEVRSARGELALAVLRPREHGASQIALSANEFAENDGVFVFNTDLAVQRGDIVGLVTISGSGVGVRTTHGATTQRWIPKLSGTHPPDLGTGTGFDKELLLRIEYLPGGQPRLPHQLQGREAARAPRGRILKRRRLHFTSGRPVEIRLVTLGKRCALDELIGGIRTARVDVPGCVPGQGDVVDFEVYAEQTPEALGIYLQYVKTNSDRTIDHFYAVLPREFQFVD